MTSSMKQINATDLSLFILTHYPDKGITPMKLQKLAYYAHVWSLVAGFSDISARFYAGQYGPVNKQIYHTYKETGNQVISLPLGYVSLEPEAAKRLTFILDNYADYSAFELSAMTHNEAPWRNAQQGALITNQSVRDFYSKQSFARNFSQSGNRRFYPVTDSRWHAFTLDMDDESVSLHESYPGYEQYQKTLTDVQADYERFFDAQANQFQRFQFELNEARLDYHAEEHRQ